MLKLDHKLVPIIGTIMESKEEYVLKLFLDNPTKEWHFEEILQEAKITRSKAHHWLKQFTKETLIRIVKPKGKMPYYLSNYLFPSYQNKKKLFAFTQMYKSGFLNHLASLSKATTVIIFGSFVRSDWYKNSDIDLFIYGKPEGLTLAKYETALHRDVHVFVCNNSEELEKLGIDFMRNVLKGIIVKGDMDFVNVSIHT